jgi:predicted phosphoribosyltransferase
MFRDRVDAGIQLAERLKRYAGRPGLILAVPRGGVPVAYAVAKQIGLPLDLLFTKKIGHPLDREFAIGDEEVLHYLHKARQTADQGHLPP